MHEQGPLGFGRLPPPHHSYLFTTATGNKSSFVLRKIRKAVRNLRAVKVSRYSAKGVG